MLFLSNITRLVLMGRLIIRDYAFLHVYRFIVLFNNAFGPVALFVHREVLHDIFFLFIA